MNKFISILAISLISLSANSSTLKKLTYQSKECRYYIKQKKNLKKLAENELRIIRDQSFGSALHYQYTYKQIFMKNKIKKISIDLDMILNYCKSIKDRLKKEIQDYKRGYLII